MRFYVWLLAQCERYDDVGRFAVIAKSDRSFPRSHRLCILLRYYSHVPLMRIQMKKVHAEWRHQRRAQRKAS